MSRVEIKGKDTNDPSAPEVVLAVTTTATGTRNALDVNITGGAASSSTEYTEGDIDSSITGVATLTEDRATNTLYTVNSKLLSDTLAGTDRGQIVQSVIHGLSTAGGGTYVDVKVNPSGSLEVGTVGTVTTITNPVTVQDGGGSLTVDGTVELGATSLAALENINVTVTSIGEVEVKNDSGNPIPVSSTDLDIRDLSSATDSVTVVATNLDIRDLNSASDSVTVTGTVSVSEPVSVDDNGGSLTIDNTDITSAATSLAVIDDWDESDRAKVNLIAGQAGITAGSGTIAANTPRVVLATDQPVIPVSDNGGSLTVDGTVTVTQGTVSTSTTSSVAGSASSVQLLASTAGRKGAYFYNDSTASAYLKLGTTASTSDFTVLMRPQAFYEIPLPVYTGRIDAIWDAANGNMRITELT